MKPQETKAAYHLALRQAQVAVKQEPNLVLCQLSNFGLGLSFFWPFPRRMYGETRNSNVDKALGWFVNALGVAQYRLGSYREAAATLCQKSSPRHIVGFS